MSPGPYFGRVFVAAVNIMWMTHFVIVNAQLSNINWQGADIIKYVIQRHTAKHQNYEYSFTWQSCFAF